MIDFVKHPADGGTPILNCNGHDFEETLIFINRIAQTLDANAIMVHAARQDLKSSSVLEVVPSKVVGLDEGRILKNGVSVARIIGLPKTKSLIRRTKGEDVPDEEADREKTRRTLESRIDSKLKEVELLRKILEST